MSIISKHLCPTMNKKFNFQFVCFTTRLNNILRLATLAAAFLALPTHALAQSSCPEDLNFDRVVNGADTMIVMNAFGNCPASPASCPADLNDDGVVNVNDVFIVLDAYGNCPIPVVVPTITSVSPANGPNSGGTTIVILGTNFTGTSRVQVGGINATRFEVLGDRTVTAVTPAGAVGLATVTVTTAGGTATRAGAFRYFDSSWYTILEQDPSVAVVPNATVRANIIATGFPWRVRDIGTGIELLLVPPGTFTMGCNAFDLGFCFSNESPRHFVTLTRAFYLGRYEVTQAQWQARMGNNPSHFSGNPNRPVEQVSWNDIAGFNTATGLSLPTEAQWEYSCRAGTTTAIHQSRPRPNGSNSTYYLGNIAWFSGIGGNASSRTHNVGGKDPNGFGFYDMSGNVEEWCNDWYGSTYYRSSPSTDPTGLSTGTSRVLRGGSYFGNDLSARRSSYRGWGNPAYGLSLRGFRVARTP
jgi:formylglycine-generating enzyme required for sulfatase activity